MENKDFVLLCKETILRILAFSKVFGNKVGKKTKRFLCIAIFESFLLVFFVLYVSVLKGRISFHFLEVEGSQQMLSANKTTSFFGPFEVSQMFF